MTRLYPMPFLILLVLLVATPSFAENKAFEITIDPYPAMVTNGQSVSFKVTGSGGVKPYYSTSSGWGKVGGDDGTTFTSSYKYVYSGNYQSFAPGCNVHSADSNGFNVPNLPAHCLQYTIQTSNSIVPGFFNYTPYVGEYKTDFRGNIQALGLRYIASYQRNILSNQTVFDKNWASLFTCSTCNRSEPAKFIPDLVNAMYTMIEINGCTQCIKRAYVMRAAAAGMEMDAKNLNTKLAWLIRSIPDTDSDVLAPVASNVCGNVFVTFTLSPSIKDNPYGYIVCITNNEKAIAWYSTDSFGGQNAKFCSTIIPVPLNLVETGRIDALLNGNLGKFSLESSIGIPFNCATNCYVDLPETPTEVQYRTNILERYSSFVDDLKWIGVTNPQSCEEQLKLIGGAISLVVPRIPSLPTTALASLAKSIAVKDASNFHKMGITHGEAAKRHLKLVMSELEKLPDGHSEGHDRTDDCYQAAQGLNL